MPARRMGFFGGGGGTFTKSVKQKACDVAIRTIEVNYSKNSMKYSLKFDVGEVGGYGGGGGYGDEDEDEDEY